MIPRSNVERSNTDETNDGLSVHRSTNSLLWRLVLMKKYLMETIYNHVDIVVGLGHYWLEYFDGANGQIVNTIYGYSFECEDILYVIEPNKKNEAMFDLSSIYNRPSNGLFRWRRSVFLEDKHLKAHELGG